MPVNFETVYDKRFEGRQLRKATIKGKTTLADVKKVANEIAGKLLKTGKNKNTTIGVAYHYNTFKWLPAILSDLTNIANDDYHVPFFDMTDSWDEIKQKLTADDFIDGYTIFLIKDNAVPDIKTRAIYKTPANDNKSVEYKPKELKVDWKKSKK